MVGGQDHLAAGGQHRVDHLAGALVHGLHGLDGGVKHAGVAHHVTVGKVQDDHVILAALDPLDALLGHLGGAHLGLQVVGGHLGAGDDAAVLAGEGLFPAAVEEEGDVGVLLGLGDAQLGHAQVGDILAHDVGQVHRGIGHLAVGHGGVVLGHADVVDGEAAIPPLEAVELVVHEDAGHLAGAVRPEVDEHHRVPFGHAAALAGDAGHHELVGDAVGIAALDALFPVAGLLALAVDKGGVGFLLAVPVLVAVHGVVAAGDGGDLADADGVQLVLDVLQEALAVVGVGVAAVHDGMDVHVFGAQGLGHIQQAEQVLLMAVDAAGAHQAHEVDGLARVDGRLHVADQDGVLLHLTVLDGLGDQGQLLVDDAARADVGVAYLRVAHLAVGQAHAHPRRTDGDMGAGGEQVVDIGGLGGGDGVAIGLVRHPAEAVKDAEHHGFLCHSLQILGF